MSRVASYKGLGAPASLIEIVTPGSTTYTLSDDQQNKLLCFKTGAAQINLPTPEEGMIFNIFFLESPTQGSTATKVLSSGYDILCAATTAKGVANGSTAENGVGIRLIGLNGTRWLADRFGGSTLPITSTTT